MDDAKKGHRPKLKNWSRDGFASVRAAEFENLSAKISREEESARCRSARENASTLTPDEFVKRYEATETPVLISGMLFLLGIPIVAIYLPMIKLLNDLS